LTTLSLDRHQLHARRSRGALWALLALAAAIGMSAAVADARHAEEPPFWTLAYNIGFGALTYAWVHFDSLRREARLPLLLKVGVVLLAVVALPAYLIASRRGTARWIALARLAGFFVLLVLAATVGYAVAGAFV
jgi:peptidoglycan/LPS O-acetylase OafA/YrhL